MWSLGILASLAIGTGGLCTAQIRGVVSVDGQGAAGVRVEVWSATAVLGVRLTDAGGRFAFQSPETSGAVGLVAKLPGFGPVQVKVVPGRLEYRLPLGRTAQRLPEQVTSAPPGPCPNTPSAAAQVLWQSIAGRYLPAVADSFGRASVVTQIRGEIDASALGSLPTEAAIPAARSVSRAGMKGYRESLQAGGYARRLRGVHWEADYGVWEYPRLESDYASHFSEAQFAEHHSLGFEPGDSTFRTIVYCPRRDRQNGLQGRLWVSEDSTFSGASWVYWVRARDREHAGGEVVFAPPAPDGLMPLVAVSGLAWRRLRSGRYWQRWERYHRWELLRDSGQ